MQQGGWVIWPMRLGQMTQLGKFTQVKSNINCSTIGSDLKSCRRQSQHYLFINFFFRYLNLSRVSPSNLAALLSFPLAISKASSK